MKTRSMNDNCTYTPKVAKSSHKRKTTQKYDPYMSEDSDISNSYSTEGSPSFKFHGSKKRNRKTDLQISILRKEYDINPHWTKEQVAELVSKTGLTEAQVYKWGWDYKKKLKTEENYQNRVCLYCEESIVPSMMEYEIFMIQQTYKASLSNFKEIVSPSLFLRSPCKV